MHRYSAASCGSGVGSSTLGGGGARDTTRSDLSYSSSNIPLSSRRPVQLAPYKPKCDREFLNSRLGPPDFYPPIPNCLEETLTREAVQNGYKEAIEGIEETKETILTLTTNTSLATNIPWSPNLINRYKESIRKRLRAINDARVQKRKAGQVYGVPLSGSLLGKSGLFPELQTYKDDPKKKWIEDLSQPHKGLRSLAEHAPHGYRKKTLFEALIKHNVPLLRATWFIKITYLHQVRPLSIGISAGGQDKTQAKRVELWTKDVIDYLQCILDESCQNDGTVSTLYNRESPQMLLGVSGQHQGVDSSQTATDSEEPSLYTKWCYMVRILHWHYAEGLLQRPQVIDWVLSQLQKKESLEALELLLPIVFEFIDSIALSQSNVRMFVDISVRRLRELSPAGPVPDSKDHPREASIVIFLSELLCYLIVVVPDTFVSLDCFPLPSCVCPSVLKRHISSLMATRDVEKDSDVDISNKMDMNSSIERQVTDRELSIADLVASIQKRAANLSKAVNPVLLRNNQGKVVQALDKALISGDVTSAYHCVFEESFTGENIPDGWLSEISPCIRSSLRFMGALEPSEIYAVFFLCEWATCDFRSCRVSLPVGGKITGKRDFSRVYMAVSVMKIKLESIRKKLLSDKGDVSGSGVVSDGTNTCLDDEFTSRDAMPKVEMLRNISQNSQNEFFTGCPYPSVAFQGQSPLHDAVVAWLDQHELQKGEGFKHLQVLLLELIRSGVFQPHVYARQLIISGIMDKRENNVDIDRSNRHRSILEQLPAPSVFHVLEDVKTESDPMFFELIRIYSNERRFALHGFLDRNIKHLGNEGEHRKSGQNLIVSGIANNLDGDASSTFEKKRKSEAANDIEFRNNKREKRKMQQVAELKHAISQILHFPESFVASSGKSSVMRSGLVQGKVKRPLGLLVGKADKGDGTPGCEECGRSKRQKITEEKGLFLKSPTFIPLDDEETWWVRKGPKASDAVKVEQPLKPAKQTARGRQKTVRKTQSLAQLAASRIENSQGASSSHICDSKVNCPHHKPSQGGEASSRIKDGNKVQHASDLYGIGKAMKRLRLVEQWSIASWMRSAVKQLIEGREKVSIKHCQSSGQAASVGTLSTASDERGAVRWHLTEDEMAVILYILDISMDMRSVVNFLLWLVPKAAVPVASLPSHGGRSIPVPSGNKEGDACEVGEGLILSCLQRYENFLRAANLLPEALSVVMNRAAVVMAAIPGGRSACPAIVYVRNLLKKYGGLSSVIGWEKFFKVSSDQRLIAELEAYKTSEGESTFGLVGVSGTGSAEDCDEQLRQRLSGRLPRIAPNLKETVQRHINKAVNQIFSKEREHLVSMLNYRTEKWDDGYQMAQHTIFDLIELIRTNHQGDASIVVAGTVATVVGSVGPAVVSMLDSAPNNAYPGSPSLSKLSSIKCARRVVQIHIYCLRLLKEAMGECQNRIVEITLATEASSAIAAAFAPGKAPRSQFQLSPETPDPSSTMANEILSNSTKGYLGKATKTAAAVAALVVGAVVHGISSLERMVALLRIRDGLEASQFFKNSRSVSNGLSRVGGAGNSLKADSSIEVYLYWFSVLISSCKTVSDGLVANLLGESNVLALARMQHMLPLNSILPPTYSIFSMVVWMHNFSCINMGYREDTQLQQALLSAVAEAIKHEPIRDVCLRDTHALYHHLACDPILSGFAATLEMQGLDIHSKLKALLPLPGRLFLHAILDSQLPPSVSLQYEGNWIHGHGDLKGTVADGKFLVDQLVDVLDNLQPAKLHWQWVELRLLLNEQVLIEKIGNQHISAVDAVQAFTLGVDQLSESEKTFTEIVLTRLLVRPDAAALYSEVVHMLGISLEDYLILHVKWVLDGVLGRKSLRQSLDSMAHQGGFSVKSSHMSPWGWSSSQRVTEVNKKKTEATSPEEGEVAEEGLDCKKDGRSYYTSLHDSDVEGCFQCQYFAIEKGLADLVLPCLARSSSEMRSTFAMELVKQMATLEQHINMPIRYAGKSISGATVVADGTGIKGHVSRKGLRGGSPGLGRRLTGVSDPPPSAAALQASMWLRLQFLLPLLRIIHVDRDSLARNMRQSLAPVLIRLLGTRVVQEAVDPFSIRLQKYPHSKKEYELHTEMSAASAAGMSGEGLFDRILSVLHALLSSTWASWLKPKVTTKSPREVLDRELAERMQAELDRMQLPSMVRIRLQAAMPLLPPQSSPTISCAPNVTTSAAPVAQSSSVNSGSFSSGLVAISQKGSVRMANAIGKCKSTLYQDPEIEIDPWTLLEDGTGSGVGASNGGGGVSGDHANLKACYWLKGAVRVRRTDLTYVGAVDDDT